MIVNILKLTSHNLLLSSDIITGNGALLLIVGIGLLALWGLFELIDRNKYEIYKEDAEIMDHLFTNDSAGEQMTVGIATGGMVSASTDTWSLKIRKKDGNIIKVEVGPKYYNSIKNGDKVHIGCKVFWISKRRSSWSIYHN